MILLSHHCHSDTPAVHFARRAKLYAELDRRFFARTRFFGAASMTNAVLARLFKYFSSLMSADSGNVLLTLGNSLERVNMNFAYQIRRDNEVGKRLDRRLVEAEQRAVQVHWRSVQDLACGKSVDMELSSLLNGSHVSCLFARFWEKSRDYCAILEDLRKATGVQFEFSNQMHRVNIGCALIDHLHRAQCGSHDHLDVEMS